MSPRILPLILLGIALLFPGCATYVRHGLDAERARQVERSCLSRNFAPSREIEQKILALDPEHVTESDLRGLLAQAPAPRIISIHGGIYPVQEQMFGFCRFLVGMGYPAGSITNPGDGTYTFSCYESSEKIAGCIAWYYEREGLRPMIVGHSQGGMQAVKVLRQLAGLSSPQLHVWNPLTWEEQANCDILDPLTGERRPVVGLQLPYVSSLGAGGLTRILPTQWDMIGRLHDVPDSVEEFTGFYKHLDPLGGDYLGYGSINHFEPMGKAVVRNVQLPTSYHHRSIPNTEHLLRSQAIIDSINNYHPNGQPFDVPSLDVKLDEDSSKILWARDVWYSVKKHWVLELQRLLRARQTHNHGH